METVPIIIQCPESWRAMLQQAANESTSKHTIQAEILKRLAESLGVDFIPPKRGRRWPKPAE